MGEYEELVRKARLNGTALSAQAETWPQVDKVLAAKAADDMRKLCDRIGALEAELAREREKSDGLSGAIEKAVIHSTVTALEELTEEAEAIEASSGEGGRGGEAGAQEEFGRMRAALEASRHALTTLHGLYAHDGKPEHAWRLDLRDDLARVDDALEGKDA